MYSLPTLRPPSLPPPLPPDIECFPHCVHDEGMVWSAFRASDDQQKYSYNIPDNMWV